MLNKLSKHIFWDTQINQLNINKDIAFIVKRVLEYGKLEDWIVLRKIYTLKQIEDAAKSLKILDKKSLSFIANLTSSPKEEFKCYNTIQYQQQLWNS